MCFCMCVKIPRIEVQKRFFFPTELIARRSNVCWQGPELEPVLETDPIAICRQLQQPSFSSGEIQLRALGEKAYEETMATLVCSVNFFMFLEEKNPCRALLCFQPFNFFLNDNRFFQET